jgi:hypothetical protein
MSHRSEDFVRRGIVAVHSQGQVDATAFEILQIPAAKPADWIA